MTYSRIAFRYLWSGLIVVVGIYLNIYSKRHKMTFAEFYQRCLRVLRIPISSSLERDRLLQNV